MAFGNAGLGRPKGSQNRVTRAAREAATKIVTDQAYLEKLMDRAKRGVIHPAIEQMLWHYAYGKPKEVIESNVTVNQQNLSELSEAELADIARKNAEEAARLAAAAAASEEALERGKTMA